MKIPIPKKLYILGYSVLGGMLFSIIPLTVTMDHWNDPFFLPRFMSLVVLLVLVILIFFGSIYINMLLYKESKKKILLLNVVSFVALTIVSIGIHYPFWISSPQSDVSYYIRDEVVRNVIIFVVSYLATKYYMKNKENQQIQMTLAQLEKEKLENQVRGLTQQLNPHFFFNALNTLSGIVQENPEKSELFIDKLSQVFRYVLKLQDYDTMELDEELKFMDDYVYLLKIRFEEMLQLKVENRNTGGYKVVPLCTQLLLENVIKHNKISRQSPMSISIIIDDEYLTETNDYCPKVSMGGSQMGLRNLSKRCELYAGKPIVIQKTDEQFTVKVPLIKS
jgi:two-component system LytT family sensor kinase